MPVCYPYGNPSTTVANYAIFIILWYMREHSEKPGSLIEGWQDVYDELWGYFGPCFRRKDTRNHAERYIRGLLGQIERKNGWQMAEYLGDKSPCAIQNFLGRASWEAEKVRDTLMQYAPEHILSDNEGGVLIVDETGFLKKGIHSVGVQRQYSGTAGRIENSQVGVFMTLAGSRGHALIDRELYLSKAWCADIERRRKAYIPEEVSFQTKPQLAQKMITRAYCQGIHPEWVLGDSVYGSWEFRNFLEKHHQPYIVGVTGQQRLWVNFRQIRIDHIVGEIPENAWLRWSVGRGTKGERIYDWVSWATGVRDDAGNQKYVLCRRSVSHAETYAYYFCYAPENTPTHKFAEAAGKRWEIECCFETAKQETGLDEYEIRSWHGWYRHMTLSMVALAFLSAIRSCCRTEMTEKKGDS